MSGNTGNRALPYPQGSDNVSSYPGLGQSLAQAVDFDVAYQSGTLAARPNANAVPVGTLYRATDVGTFAISDGTTWNPLVFPSGQVFTANGTWNKPTGAVTVEVILVGAGGGGGSGARDSN